MDTFGYKGAYKIQGVMSCGYPVIALVGIFFLVQGSGAQFTDMAPFIILGLIAWLGYEVFRLSQRYSYSIAISDEGIRIKNDPLTRWEDVERAEFHGTQFGKDAVITLYPKEGEPLKIPASIDHLEIIQGTIENKVANIQNKEK